MLSGYVTRVGRHVLDDGSLRLACMCRIIVVVIVVVIAVIIAKVVASKVAYIVDEF